jgi:hypothetical protein
LIGEHAVFRWPSEREQKLWRYMDLSKFLSMLQKQMFWMTRADLLGDPFEGSLSMPTRQRLLAVFEGSAAAVEMYADRAKEIREHLFISCWHANADESAAMWKLYAQSSEAVCIQTTFIRLAEQLPPTMHGGGVSYVDYETAAQETGNIFYPVLYKRRSFEHEHEVRFVAWDQTAPDKGGDALKKAVVGNGLAWPLHPAAYVDAIYVSPTSPDWFVDVVSASAQQYGLDVPVHHSSLHKDPVF